MIDCILILQVYHASNESFLIKTSEEENKKWDVVRTIAVPVKHIFIIEDNIIFAKYQIASFNFKGVNATSVFDMFSC